MIKQLAILLFFLVLFSCKKEPASFHVKEPEGLAIQDSLNRYQPLLYYVNKIRDFNPLFRLGAGVGLGDYVKQESMYGLINSNFDQFTLGYAMKHGAIVQNDGTLMLNSVQELVKKAKEAGKMVYGHTLVWHANQNATYLDSLIAPKVISGSGGPTWEVVSSQDFESGSTSDFQTSQNTSFSYTADGEGFNEEGRALMVKNDEVRDNDYGSQFFFIFPNKVKKGEKYRLTMNVKANDPSTAGTQAQDEPFQYLFYDFFGAVDFTTDWTTYTKTITVSSDQDGAGTIAFNLGNTATTYYFDNIKIEKYSENGGSALEPSVIENTDFEAGDDGWSGWGDDAQIGLSDEGEGFNGSGFAFTFSNTVEKNYWDDQVAYDLVPLKKGSTYKLNFKVRATTPGSLLAEVQSTSDFSSDPIGHFDISSNWEEYTLETTITADDRNRLVISFGDYAGQVYIDDVTLRRVNPNGGKQIIEKTPEEKKQIISDAMKDWIAAMMTNFPYVHCWDVVNEPMDDGHPYQLKTGVGKDLKPDEFYWQDYMGKDYAVKAFKWARQYGKGDDTLFINDYNLEFNLDKCKGLIDYVEYIESKGAQVDGIGTQMHIDINTDKDKIKKMFELLAATGKLIRISELDIGLGNGIQVDEATDELYKKQAEMYKYVVEEYFDIIPKKQQFGITVWSPLDSPKESSWRAGEPIGLWTLDYYRKRAYAGFVKGLEDVIAENQ